MQKPLFTMQEMYDANVRILKLRGVSLEQIAEVAYDQQSKFNKNVSMELCLESVRRVLSFRDVFHIVQLGVEIDIIAEQGHFIGPIAEILTKDLGVFGIDEVFGLQIAGKYGAIGQTNFGDIDVNKPGFIKELDAKTEDGKCNTFLDDICGAIAAAASTRVAQIMSEGQAEDIQSTRTYKWEKKDR